MIIKDLHQEIPYKWRVQSCNEKGAICIRYINARNVEDILDEVVGQLNWKTEYYRDGKNVLVCKLSIWDEKKAQWVSKEDCGTESDFEKEKGEYSDAFKRAAVRWGIGRFLYKKKPFYIQNVKLNKKSKYEPVDEEGNFFYYDTLSLYIESRIEKNIKGDNDENKSLNPIKEVDSFIQHFVEKIKEQNETGYSLEDIINFFSTPLYRNLFMYRLSGFKGRLDLKKIQRKHIRMWYGKLNKEIDFIYEHLKKTMLKIEMAGTPQ